MSKILLLSTIFVFITGCSISNKPTFKHIDSIEVTNISLDNVTLNANAVFNNPNNLKGKLSINDMHLFIDSMDIGVISAKEFDIPAKTEFAIPLRGTFSLSKIYKENKNSVLGSILKVIQTDSVTVQYKGSIRYHLGSFSYPYAINKEQKIRLR